MSKNMRDRYEDAYYKTLWDIAPWRREVVTGEYPESDRIRTEFAQQVIQLAESNKEINFYPDQNSS